MAFEVPRLGRVSDAGRALDHMVGRLMDAEEGLKRLPPWERFLYEMTMGSDQNERSQAIEWYEELSEESPDPLADLHLAILQGEDGRLDVLRQKVPQWERLPDPYQLYAKLIRAGYLRAQLPAAEAFQLQAELAELPVTGWFYSRLATHIAEGAGDRALLTTLEASSLARTDVLIWRSRAFALLEISLMLLGGGVLILWVIRRGRTEMLRVASSELPPRWAGSLGAAVLLRGGAIGALLTMGFLFASVDYSSLRVLVVPLSNLPLLALAYYHLLRPQGQSFSNGFGLRIEPHHLGRLVLAVLAVVSAGLMGEWIMGRIAEPLKLSSHWTEWFDADLVWGPPSVLAISLLEYVIFAPLFEELAFRGLLFGVLRRRFRFVPAALVSAAIFAVAHGYGVIGFFSVLWSGILWAWAYERTGSLWPGVIGHAANNLLVCLSVMALLRP
jgi:membrane protease YdiL (CAAX protease family)